MTLVPGDFVEVETQGVIIDTLFGGNLADTAEPRGSRDDRVLEQDDSARPQLRDRAGAQPMNTLEPGPRRRQGGALREGKSEQLRVAGWRAGFPRLGGGENERRGFRHAV